MSKEAHKPSAASWLGRSAVYCPWACVDVPVVEGNVCTGCHRDIDLDVVFRCRIHRGQPLMENGKCSICVWERFGYQLKEII